MNRPAISEARTNPTTATPDKNEIAVSANMEEPSQSKPPSTATTATNTLKAAPEMITEKATSKAPPLTDGNDRVTLDPPPNKPLVLPTTNNTQSTQQTPNATVPTAPDTALKASGAGTAPNTATTPAPVAVSPQDFSPYVRPGDASVQHAKQRLQTALVQTYQLRQAFTERVYGKYRVCLQRPRSPATFRNQVQAAPAVTLQRLTNEMAAVQHEKDAEKKQAAQLNAAVQVMQQQQTTTSLSPALAAAAVMWTTGSVDHAEQLSYMSAGLNLIILPEEDAPHETRNRAPIHPVTGQRDRHISAAAATAGDVMLERKRKALALREERLVSPNGETPMSTRIPVPPPRPEEIVALADPKYRAHTGATKTPRTSTTTTTPTSHRASLSAAVAGKAARSRAPPGLSAATLLNLNPSAEEFIKPNETTATPSAATMALAARSSAASHKMTRLRHPHPESLGGRRRMNAPARTTRPEPFLQSYLALTLPPLPATKERLERKPLPVVADTVKASVQKSVQSALGLFQEREMTQIELLQCLQSQAEATTVTQEQDSKQLDPTLTFSVLHAVGLIDRARAEPFALPPVHENNAALWSPKLVSLHKKITSSANGTVTEALFGRCRKRGAEDGSQEPSAKRPKEVHVPVESLRGGGEAMAENEEDSSVQKKPLRSARKNSDASRSSRKSSDASDLSRSEKKTAPPQPQATFPTPQSVAAHPSSGLMPGYPPSTMRLANQIGLQQLHHPAAGDLADYLGSLQAHAAGFDLSALVSSGQSSLAALGVANAGMYPIPDRASAARVVLAEQQAATMIGGTGFPRPASAPFPHAAASPLLAPQPSTLFGGGQLMLNSQMTAQEKTPNSLSSLKQGDLSKAQASEKVEATAAEKATASESTGNLRKQPGSSSSGSKSETAKAGASGDSTEIHAEAKANSDSGGDESEKPRDEGKLKFFVPDTPTSISSEEASRIRSGLFHEAVQGVKDANKLASLSEYLLRTGAAVPIQKALVSSPLKERLNAPLFKTSSGTAGTPPISRDIVTAAILIWLWANHESSFQRAFAKSGRIDVDPECKWVMQAAVDTVVSELGLEITQSTGTGGESLEPSAPSKVATESDTERGKFKRAEIRTACVVSKALTTKFNVNQYVNHAIPQFESLVAFLDESRLGALRAKSQERVLLANLLARSATMSDSFAHAYVSAMVRAGEALGHGKLFEFVQNEEVLASTMIPYDIFTDEAGGWEDPCQVGDVFSSGLTGDDLMRKAHARAMIQKSLRKLQDRHNIRGGAVNYGPYPDPSDKDASKGAQGSASTTSAYSRPSLKRRYSSISEPPVQPGTGSARATSWALYDPRHASDPMVWHSRHLANKPYGRHRRGQRSRSLSLSLSARSGEPRNIKRVKRSMSIPGPSDAAAVPESAPDVRLPKSTLEIDWGDVAGIFTKVEVSRQRRSASKRSSISHHHSAPVVLDASGNIFAPFCRKVQGELNTESDDSEEEDLRDETVLANHQVVLDEMKVKINTFLEARKKQQERRKNRYSK